ncbi:MAG TPA: translocation/assembly module TamB domain-containing protein [Reyranella sp.]|nr:translocation/assembly module TamB domain-containing protein [Reyranella sp.]
MRPLKLLGRILGWTMAGLVVLLALAFGVVQTGVGKRMLAGLISSDTIEVSGLDGFLPTNVYVTRVVLKDRQGPWASLDDANLRWSFLSLFTGRVQVDAVTAHRIEVLRPPLPPTTPGKSSGGGFSLPVGVDLGALAVDDLHLGAPLGGVDSHWQLAGSALLADRAQSRLKLDMVRTDGPADKLSADLGFDLDRFSVDGTIAAEESSTGGVIAALIGRPDLDRVSMKLSAKGDRADGHAELTVAAGDALSATGKARWHREQATAITMDVSAVAPGLPDSPIARLLKQPATLKSDASLDDAGVLTVRSLALAVGPAKLDATARYDSNADKLSATTVLETGALPDLTGGVTWKTLKLDARTELSGLRQKPEGRIAVQGGADDVADTRLGDKAPPPAHVDLSAAVALEKSGRLVVQSFETSSPLVALKLTGAFTPDGRAGEAKVALDLKDFAPLSAMAGTPVTGRAHLDLDLAAKPGEASVKWQGTLDDLTVPGLPPGLERKPVTLGGAAGLKQDQSWRLDEARVGTEGMTLTLSGSGKARDGVLDLLLDLPNIGLVRQDMTGALTARAHVALDGPALTGTVKAGGDLAGQTLALGGRFARAADGGIAVPSLQASWASASVDVKDFALRPGVATGSVHVEMAHLEDLKPLVGADLGGALKLDAGTADGRKVTVALRGDKVKGGTTSIGNLQLDATVDDPFGQATVDAALKAERLGGVGDLGTASVTLKGDRSAFDVGVKVAGAATDATLAARVEPTPDEIEVALQKLDARFQNIPVALNTPARVHVVGSTVKIEAASLRLGGGRLGISGTVDRAASDLALDLAGLPLSVVDTFAPGSNLEGTLQAKVRVTGALADPRIEASYSASGLRVKQPETALLPSLALKGTASMAAHQATFDANISAGGATQLNAKGKASLPQGDATVALSGALDIAPFAPALGNAVRNVGGTLRPHLTIALNGKTITGAGTMTLSGGTMYLPASGMRLTGGEASFSLQGESLHVDKFVFQTARSGSIAVAGAASLNEAEGFPTDLTVTAHQALVANRPDMLATVSSNVKITGSLLKGFDVAGPVTVDRAEIGIGGTQAANYPTIPVVEINGSGPTPTAPKPPPPAPKGKQPPKPPELVRLALTIAAPQAVFVRGRGLEAEVGGSFTVTGNPQAPAVLGALTLRRGTFNLVGHQLDFIRGNVALANVNEIDPELDFAATTTVESTTIEVDITGTSKAPKIALTASPVLPQDEAMAMLLFGKPSSSLSPTELLSAAEALAELTGGSPVGGSFMTRIRRGLGLDQLSVTSTSSGVPSSPSASSSSSSTTALSGGRYVAPGVYVGAQQGASTDSSRGVVEIEVFKHTKIEGAIGTDSNDKIGAKMEWDY